MKCTWLNLYVLFINSYAIELFTLKQFWEDLSYIEASFGGDFPAVNIEFIFILFDGAFIWDSTLILHICFVSDHHQHNLIQVKVLIYVDGVVLARRIHASTSR